MEKCLICNAHTMSFEHPTTHVIFHECSFCGVIFKDKKYLPTPDDEIKRYQEHHNEPSNEGYVHFLQKFIDQTVTPYLTQGDILDFGSGPNPVLKLILEKSNYKVDCYDPFFSSIRPGDQQLYDMITSTEVMEHVHHPMEVLHWIDQHVKPQGYISLMTLFYPKEKELFYKWFYIRDYTHVIFYTTKTFEVIAQMMNWDIIKTDDYRIVVFKKRG